MNLLIPRATVQNNSAIEASVWTICEEVRTLGEAALRDHAQKFDRVLPASFKVSREQLRSALENTAPDLVAALEEAITRVRRVSAAVVSTEVSVELGDGANVTQRYVPVDSVGLYVPGGKAVYPSSVIMNVVPAQVANVPRIVIASPAQAEYDGLPHPSILAAAELLGVHEVYAIGGASAVAAFAHGVSEIGLDPVTMVTGPGNIYVATAKRLLRGKIGIDSEAGPTEILIVADKTANPAFVAADLISQAEHDENAAAVLVTDSRELIDSVSREVDRQLAMADNRERAAISLAGEQSALVLVEDLEAAIAVANHYATEHLEIQTERPQEVAQRITNAGALFIGDFSPVSLGDYLAGSNHVLPTSQQAKFGPGLGVHTFLRPQQVISYSKSALAQISRKLEILSHTEGLSAHGTAASIREDR
ncbi:histidinol dehydrogenase [Aquiluna sp. KACHI24]|uniref:histidinol dehydrogenase n=1 Tax=Aquiluna sp. KACHI24 TaxID=2968831 RepID=UPI002230E11F|nr:histidinol dehydrogenase [Aquiluna sp. KACHI24]